MTFENVLLSLNVEIGLNWTDDEPLWFVVVAILLLSCIVMLVEFIGNLADICDIGNLADICDSCSSFSPENVLKYGFISLSGYTC